MATITVGRHEGVIPLGCGSANRPCDYAGAPTCPIIIGDRGSASSVWVFQVTGALASPAEEVPPLHGRPVAVPIFCR
jgi:hypothetical protein